MEKCNTVCVSPYQPTQSQNKISLSGGCSLPSLWSQADLSIFFDHYWISICSLQNPYFLKNSSSFICIHEFIQFISLITYNHLFVLLVYHPFLWHKFTSQKKFRSNESTHSKSNPPPPHPLHTQTHTERNCEGRKAKELSGFKEQTSMPPVHWASYLLFKIALTVFSKVLVLPGVCSLYSTSAWTFIAAPSSLQTCQSLSFSPFFASPPSFLHIKLFCHFAL